MKLSSKAMVALVTLMMLISSGCASLDAQLRDAAGDKGRVAAGAILPDLPTDCRKREAHAPLIKGAEIRSILKRERAALDRANGRIDRCATYYDTLKKDFAEAE